MKKGYSPEQIAGTLALCIRTPCLRVSHETIYTAIYAMPRGELRTQVIGWLRFGYVKRRPRARGEDRRGRMHRAASAPVDASRTPDLREPQADFYLQKERPARDGHLGDIKGPIEGTMYLLIGERSCEQLGGGRVEFQL